MLYSRTILLFIMTLYRRVIVSELDFYPDGWSEFCSKELAGLRELKIPPALAATILAAGVGRRDKTIDTREACRVSASVGGHGGIEGEDRALSYLSAHVL